MTFSPLDIFILFLTLMLIHLQLKFWWDSDFAELVSGGFSKTFYTNAIPYLQKSAEYKIPYSAEYGILYYGIQNFSEFRIL